MSRGPRFINLRLLTLLAMVIVTVMGVAGGAYAARLTTGTLTGYVTNAAGIGVAGANVAATDSAGKTTTVVTSSSGLYKLTLAAATYSVTYSATNYVPQTKTGISVLAGKTTTVNVALVSEAVSDKVEHVSKISSYAGPQTCLACHSRSAYGTDLMNDVLTSVHFGFRTPNASVDIPGAGSHGMLDRACGLPGTTIMANNFAGTAISPSTGLPLDDGCGKCHIAYRPPYRYANVTDAAADINCLICHAETYSAEEWALVGGNPTAPAREVFSLADGTKSWAQDRTLLTAQSVGSLPKSKYCLRCHEHGMDGYKRGTPFATTTDVHAAKGFDCIKCHTSAKHRIARGNFVTDGMANESPAVEVSCAKCHGIAPHKLANAESLNKHAVNVACESCHIPAMQQLHSGLIARRAWAPYTLDPTTGIWSSTPEMLNAEYPGFYDANTTYYTAGTAPTIRWFSGDTSMLAQPGGGYSDRASAGGCSKLYAFKPFVNGMLFDAGWLPGPDASFDLVNGTWPYSMKQFYEQNWAKFLAFGFVDSKYSTATSYWNERPDMAMMLNQMPMMLQFDRAIYLSEAGKLGANATPGPQNGLTYPGIVKAINNGMGTMAIDMGYFPAGTDPVFAGSNMWSGSFFGMWVPVNMETASPFAGEIASFITMSHGVKPASQAATCYSCHYTTTEYAAAKVLAKRVDFGKLGYPNTDANAIVDPLYDITAAPADKVTVSSISMKASTSKKGTTLTVVVTAVDTATRTPLANVTVNGTLTGPAGSIGLPKSYTGTTGSTGTVTFTYAATTLTSGTYTFTVNDVTYAGVTEIEGCSQTFVK